MKNSILLFAIINLIPLISISQTKPEIEWQKTYGGYSRDELNSLLETEDGGYLLGGWSMSTDGDIKSVNSGESDFWVVKTDKIGSILWERTYGMIGVEMLSDIKPTLDGGFIIGGSTNMIDFENKNEFSGIQNYLIYKIDGSGNIIWRKIFGGSANEVLSKIEPTGDGGYLLIGSTTSVDGDVQSRKYLDYNWLDIDIWVVKIDKNGQLLWEKSFGRINSGEGVSCIYSLNGGGYLLGGYSQTNEEGIISEWGDFYLIEIDNEGKLIWEKTYGGTGHENLIDICKTKDDGYLLAGNTTSTDGDVQSRKEIPNNIWNMDYWIVKIDSSRNIVWEKAYGDIGLDFINNCCETIDGGYLLAGGISETNAIDSSSETPTHPDCWAVKIDEAGNIVWDAKYGGSEDDAFTAVIAEQGSYLFGGYTKSNNGDIQSGNHGFIDFWVLKYNPNLNLSADELTNTNSFYPNPVKDKLKTNYKKEGIVSIFDLFGKLLLKQNVTKYKQVIDVSSFPSGTYIINFNAKDQYESSKLIKM